MKALIVEDDVMMSQMLRDAFTDNGHDVEVTGSAEKAIPLLQTIAFDTIVLDVGLPGLDGLQLSRWIRSRPHLADIYIIVVTARSVESGVSEALKAGADDYLEKPFGPAAMRIRIAVAERQVAAITSRKLLAGVLNSSMDAIMAFRSVRDEGGRIVDFEWTLANESAARSVKCDARDLLGKLMLRDIPDLGDAAIFEAFVSVVETGNVSEFQHQFQHELISGWFRIVAVKLDDGIAVTLSNVTLRKQAEDALRDSEQRYALAASAANDGLWDWDLLTGRIVFSGRWKAMIGYGEDEIGTNPNEWFGRIHQDDLEQVKERITLHLDAKTSHFECEYRTMHKDGTYRWVLARGLAIWDPNRKAYRMAGSQTDITDRKAADENLVRKAFYDPLTDLPNRALFLDHLRRAVATASKRQHHMFAVLFIDLDRFKIVNDSLGHLIGDQLLVQIGRRLRSCLRPGDVLARIGGDEFTLLLEPVKEAGDAQLVAERIHRQLEVPFDLEGHEVFTSVSIGIALGSSRSRKPEEVLRDADMALYRAKSLGRSRHEVYDASLHSRAMRLLRLESELRRAVERNEFVLHYQPIVEIDSGRIIGFEALVRWLHPQRGLVSPAEFIGVAEETGLIVNIGQWVLYQACQQMSQWQRQFPEMSSLTVSVNISSRQFSRPDLCEQIAKALQSTGVPASRLKLEVTESVIMGNAESAARLLAELREMGIHLLVDDFGTGYSSLSYLHRFPFNTLKIDRAFVTRIDTDDGKNAEIVRAIIALARSLGLGVIAEGIETEEQNESLRALQCKLGQGYYFYQPLESEHATSALVTQMEHLLGKQEA